METTKTTINDTKEGAINKEAKKIAIIAYITIIGLVIAYMMNNEKKLELARYHILQSVGLVATSLALWIVGLIPILGWIISILGTFVILYMWIMGLMNAINQKKKPVPFFGEKYVQWFGNILK